MAGIARPGAAAPPSRASLVRQRFIRHVLLDSRGRDFGVDGGKPDRAADDQDKQGDEDRGKRRPAPPGRGESVTHAAPFAPARRSLYSPGGMPTALPRIDGPTGLVGLMGVGKSTAGTRLATSGDASCRERVCLDAYKSVVDVSIKK